MEKSMFDYPYSATDTFWGEKPNIMTVKSLEYIDKGHVLDIGAGEGRDSIFLANKGFSVEAIDSSSAGILRCQELSANLPVVTHVCDAREFVFEHQYDMVLCLSVLQLFSLEEIHKIIKATKMHTNNTGLNVISVFGKNNPSKECPFSNPDGTYTQYHLFSLPELLELYSDWKTLEFSDHNTTLHQHGSGKEHYHHIVSIIAEKG